MDALLEGLPRLTPDRHIRRISAPRVYKIARDAQGVRLTFLKVTGGVLRVKETLGGTERDSRESWSEKVDQIRIYSGAKFRTAEQAEAGTVCAVAGLEHTYPGEGLGFEEDWTAPLLEPVLTYQVELPPDCDPHTALQKLRQLEEEDPQLHVLWKEFLREIHVQLMGEVQLEVWQRLIRERFGMEVSFGQGGIVYRETIGGPVEGVGISNPCGTMRRCICCWSRESGAAACRWAPSARRTSWTAAGSG